MADNSQFSLHQLPLTIATGIFLSALWLVNLLPWQTKLRIGKTVGLCIYYIPNSRTRITRVNLGICYPDLSDSERESMVRQTFINFGASIVESAMGWWDDAGALKAKTEVRGAEHIEQAISKNRGVLLIGAHFSTLDLSASLISNFYPCYGIYRIQNNWLFNKVMTRGRMRTMLGMIPHTSLRTAARKIKQGNIVWYSPDQDMGAENSVFAPFFGHPAATLTATARLAALTAAPLVMLASYRKPDDSGYVIEFLPGPDNFPAGNEVENATAVNQLIERGVRLAPSQYYWFHRRFKSQPGLKKGALYNTGQTG